MLAAERGHEVELVERADRIGGQLHAWAAASVFQHRNRQLDRFYGASSTGRVSPSGSAPTPPRSTWTSGTWCCSRPAPSPETTELDAVELLTDRHRPRRGEVTVFGDTETAMFAALWLAEQGKQVSLVSPAELPAHRHQRHGARHLAGLLTELGGTVTTGGIRPTIGTVVSATPRIASTVLADLVDDEPSPQIGTRLRGGRMYEATQSGFWAAAQIGEPR